MNIVVSLTLLALFMAGLRGTDAAPNSINAGLTSRVLMIDSSSMPVGAGKAILTIGALHRADGVYSGDYKIRVSPYFFKNERGRLAIVVSDESLAEINQGKATSIIGTATSSGKGGIRRHIDATATPDDMNRGTIKVWFMAGDRKMIFKPAYHFSEKLTADAAGQGVEAKLASNWPRRQR